MTEKKESKRITFCRKCKKRNAKPSADNQRLQEARMERDNMLKDAREIKEKMIADSKDEAQAQGLKMIEQAKAAIESEKMQLWLN
jgi:F-type H+-transporting ATPase subunit b